MWKILPFLGLIALSNAVENINPSIINKNIERTIDLQSQLVKITGTVTIENTGKQGVGSYLLSFEKDLQGIISYVGVQDSQKSPLKASPTSVSGRGKLSLKILKNEVLTM